MIPLLQNILDQPDNLRHVADYHARAGRPALEDAARRVGTGRSLILSGMGSSLFACYAQSASLASHGITSTVLDASEFLHYYHAIAHAAVVILVSRSGESIEVVKLLPLLKAQGAAVVGVTNEPGSTLARQADQVLLMASRADEAVAIQTYTATLATFYLLAKALAGKLDAARRELEETCAALEASLGDWVAASQAWSSFFDQATCVYLLARGAALASAMEGALLFHEVAKFPAVSMGAGNFRHGPIEVAEDRHFRALVFMPEDSTRDLNLALGRDLARLGGQVRCIGPAADWPTPDVPAELQAVVDIVPIQLAALRLAEGRGITPGKFRVAAQVTRREDGF